MFILRHPSTTTNHGAPANWNPDTDGPCETLPTISVNLDGRIVHASFWQPEPEELELLNRGGAIELHIHQPVHPVVSMSVNAWPGAVAPVADAPITLWQVEEFKIWKGVDQTKPTWSGLNLVCRNWEEANGYVNFLSGNKPEGVYRVVLNTFPAATVDDVP